MVTGFLKKLDLFGHNLRLTINDGNGKQQTSSFGGMVTLFIYAFLMTFIVIKVQKMQDGSYDNIMQTEDLVDINRAVRLEGMMPYMEFNSIDPDIWQYLEIHLHQIKDLNLTNQRVFRICKRDDLAKYGLADKFDEMDPIYYNRVLFCVDDFDTYFVGKDPHWKRTSQVDIRVYYNKIFNELEKTEADRVNREFINSYFRLNFIQKEINLKNNPPLSFKSSSSVYFVPEPANNKYYFGCRFSVQQYNLQIDHSRLDIFGLQDEEEFLKIKFTEKTRFIRTQRDIDQNLFFWTEIQMSQTKISQEKSLYTFFDLLSDVGGLLNLIITLFAMFMQPYNHSLFLYNSLAQLFCHIEGLQNIDSFIKFIWHHRVSFPVFCSSKSHKIIKECTETLDKELDVHDLVRKLRKL